MAVRDLKDMPNFKLVVWIASVVVSVGAIWTFSGRVHDTLARHVDRFFFSTAEAQVLLQDVREAVNTAKEASSTAKSAAEELKRYIWRQELKERRDLLDRLRGELAETELWESQNGVNALSRDRKEDLRHRIESTAAQIRCLETPSSPGC